MKVIVAILFVLIFIGTANAQNITVKYVQEGVAVHAYALSGGTSVWDHYLGPEEITTLNNDPTTLDAQIVTQAKAVASPVTTPTPPVPVDLRMSSAINPTTAQTTAATYATKQQTLKDILIAVENRLKLLPVQQQITLINSFRTAVDAAVTALPAPIVH